MNNQTEITHDKNGNPYSIPLPKVWLNEFEEQQELQNSATKQLKPATNNNGSYLESEDVTLTSVRNARILEMLVTGASKRSVAAAFKLSESSIERIAYSPENRTRLSDCVTRMNESMASSLEILVEQLTNVLTDILITGDTDAKLKTADRIIGLYVKLNKLNECNVARVSQTRTVKGTDGTTDKMTLTQAVTA